MTALAPTDPASWDGSHGPLGTPPAPPGRTTVRRSTGWRLARHPIDPAKIGPAELAGGPPVPMPLAVEPSDLPLALVLEAVG
jgi:hypothetical protein